MWSTYLVRASVLRTGGGWIMLDIDDRAGLLEHLPHDLSCLSCSHPVHTYLPCGDACDCPPVVMPGSQRTVAA